jgi:L-ribulose-5-phosphate 3-epimerase
MCPVGCLWGRTSRVKKSINAWTFPAGTSVAEMARAAAAAGFEAIELVLADQAELTFDSPAAQCSAAAQSVRDQGLEVASLASGVFWETHFGSPDPNVRTKARDLVLAGLDRAAWLGAPVLLVVPAVVGRADSPEPITSYADALARSFEALHELSFEAEDRGVAIAIENVWNKFLLSPIEFRELIDRVNSPWVGAYLDVGNVLAFGYPQDWIATLGGRILRVHVKDYRLGARGAGGFCQLGDGDVDWPAVMAALVRYGYDGPLTYEGPGDPVDIAQRLTRILALAPSRVPPPEPVTD